MKRLRLLLVMSLAAGLLVAGPAAPANASVTPTNCGGEINEGCPNTNIGSWDCAPTEVLRVRQWGKAEGGYAKVNSRKAEGYDSFSIIASDWKPGWKIIGSSWTIVATAWSDPGADADRLVGNFWKLENPSGLDVWSRITASCQPAGALEGLAGLTAEPFFWTGTRPLVNGEGACADLEVRLQFKDQPVPADFYDGIRIAPDPLNPFTNLSVLLDLRRDGSSLPGMAVGSSDTFWVDADGTRRFIRSIRSDSNLNVLANELYFEVRGTHVGTDSPPGPGNIKKREICHD